MEEKMESASQPTEETQPIAEASSDSIDSTSSETKTDWWNPDTWGKRSPKEVVSEIQKQYNEVATKAKRTETLEKDYQATRSELEAVVNDVRAALADPKVYQEQRRKLGYEVPNTGEVPKLDFSKMETVGDVVNSFKTMQDYFERRISDIERTAEIKADNKIRQAVDPISKERWSVALETMKSKYGDKWPAVERKVVMAITNGAYAYRPGSEKEILDKAFRGECPEEYEAYLKDSLKKRSEEKSKATTAQPRTAAPKSVPRDGSAEAIIARVNARLKA